MDNIKPPRMGCSQLYSSGLYRSISLLNKSILQILIHYSIQYRDYLGSFDVTSYESYKKYEILKHPAKAASFHV